MHLKQNGGENISVSWRTGGENGISARRHLGNISVCGISQATNKLTGIVIMYRSWQQRQRISISGGGVSTA